MPRLFISSMPKGRQGSEVIRLIGEDSRYIQRVLRCRKGDAITLFDGKGNSFKAEITKISPKEVYAEIKSYLSPIPEPPLRLTLLQAVLKAQKMDLVIQKSTELGVTELIPIITERTEVRETRKLLRWQKIAIESARQCGRSTVPSVREPVNLKEFFLSGSQLKGIVFWEEEGIALKMAINTLNKTFDLEKDKLFVLIGPEGGFTQEEVISAEGKGLLRVSLGKRILRAETASIVAVALVQVLMGDMV